jgi:hypothetical protein
MVSRMDSIKDGIDELRLQFGLSVGEALPVMVAFAGMMECCKWTPEQLAFFVSLRELKRLQLERAGAL